MKSKRNTKLKNFKEIWINILERLKVLGLKMIFKLFKDTLKKKYPESFKMRLLTKNSENRK